MIKKMIKLFISKNERIIKGYQPRVDRINNLEPHYKKLSDIELKEKFLILKKSVLNKEKILNDVLEDSFAITREVSIRVLGLRHFDVQLIGGIVLSNNSISEMKTGEGKTLVATLPAILFGMLGKGIHIVTVNDYLSKRDSQDMLKIYNFLGYSVGCLGNEISSDKRRKDEYLADITYGTNNEYGFDYLRDNMKIKAEDKVQRGHYFAIIDEVDSILIDEARTPLIISGPVELNMKHYDKANEIAQEMLKGTKEDTKPGEPDKTTGDFIVDEKNRSIITTEDGLEKAQKLFGVDNLYSIQNSTMPHYLDQALKSHYIFKKDIDYVIQNNEIIIVDEFTGRLSEGRRFGDGLHQALECKEKLNIKEESQTLAEITYQNYFRSYEKLSGMTGTAQTEATEFLEIYKLNVISIPTHLPIKRKDKNDLIYNTEREKINAVVKRVREVNKLGQPILIGTGSIEKSELIHKRLTKENIKHNILNAKNHENEALIIENAGKKFSVTIATNMAGRGVDIKINKEVEELGGLFILGTERHESRRIDNQLRGRSGRQGDNGLSQFYLSLDDNLLRIFGGDKIKSIISRIGIEEGEYIDSRLITRSVESAQKKVEIMHYESRKDVIQYDDIANKQREVIYNFRNQLLDLNFNIESKIFFNYKEYIDYILDKSNIFNETSVENQNIDSLITYIKSDIKINLNMDDFIAKGYENIKNKLSKIILEKHKDKFNHLTDDDKSEVQRIIYLQILDSEWRSHLHEMDTLKAGIGLRGYNQKDPLTEYKKETYGLFLELINRVKIETIKLLQIIEFNYSNENITENLHNQDIEEIQHNLEQNANSMKYNSNESTSATPEIKQKRNDLCKCGSGKKFKKCCGK